jgi:NADH pyrophosphatase NudC (nudix superfamily)
MLGFVAEAEAEADSPVVQEIRLNDGELEDAAWFTRKELRSGLLKLPSRISIARRLVDGWLSSDDPK